MGTRAGSVSVCVCLLQDRREECVWVTGVFHAPLLSATTAGHFFRSNGIMSTINIQLL